MNDPVIIMFVGGILGAAIVAFCGVGFLQWREAAKASKRPAQLKKEYEEKMKKARKEASKARGKRAAAVLAILVAFLLILIFMVVAGGLAEAGPWLS